ncbi:MAG: phosphatidylserine decarboxylase [Eubacteriales bacterium]|nr:phosphatidylserine decarboxylase [Eubacteriales bacterium]
MMDGMSVRKGVSINEYKSKGTLRFLYNTAVGRLFLGILKRRGVSRLIGRFLNSRASRIMLGGFCKSANIDLSQTERTQLKQYKSYNDLFTRVIRPDCRPIDRTLEHLIAPCDGGLTAYAIDDDSSFFIKGGEYSLADMLGEAELAKQFVGGTCLIFRLEICDYHRYCYIDDGHKGEDWSLGSELHTVQPIAMKRYNIYKRNYRVCSVMQTKNFGTVAEVEVGAMCVGRIENHLKTGSFVRGEEKGLFEMGGSTIVLLIKAGAAKIDEDILCNTAQNRETPVRMGERIGTSLISS